jgi:hypothetical protein
MNWGYVSLIAISFGMLLIIAQRVVPQRRRVARWFIFILGVLLILRGNLGTENLFGFFGALVMSFLFWLLIGRYNPVSPEDSITVYGMND